MGAIDGLGVGAGNVVDGTDGEVLGAMDWAVVGGVGGGVVEVQLTNVNPKNSGA